MNIRLLILVSTQIFARTKTEHFDIVSKYIDETRKITIALPQQYENSTKEYLMILILDGGLLFD